MKHRLLIVLVFFVLSALAHGLWVELGANHYDGIVSAEDQNQGNIIRLEKFIFSPKPCELLIVGSSLSNRLPMGKFPASAQNMALAGDSSLTMLELLAQQPTLPKLILVEANVILRPLNTSLISQASAFPKRWIKQSRASYRPTTMMLSDFTQFMLAGLHVARKLYHIIKPSQPMPHDSPQTSSAQDLVEKRVRIMIESKQKAPEQKELELSTQEIKQRIDLLVERGAQVVLVEMPMDSRVSATPYYRECLRAMHTAFPENQYTWIIPQLDHVESTDGLHLAPQSAIDTAILIDEALTRLHLYEPVQSLKASACAH